MVTQILFTLVIYAFSCLIFTTHIERTFSTMTRNYGNDKNGYFDIRNTKFSNNVVYAYLMRKKKITITLLAPLVELYLQGCKLGFVIFKLKIKGNYEDRLSSWVF